jgi:hypothetical protein
MFSVARNPGDPSGASISPVAQLEDGKRPESRPSARFLASRSVNRIRIMSIIYRLRGDDAAEVITIPFEQLAPGVFITLAGNFDQF